MTGKLCGKIAIVTASTEGIGFAISRRLARDGAKVMLSSRKEKNVETAVNTLRSENLDVHGVVCHVGKKTDRQTLISETLKRFGGLDILVSNAAANPMMGQIMETTEDVWDKIFDINVKSSFFLMKEVYPHMVKAGGGSIVFVSSVVGYTPSEYLGAYSISKTALLGLTKALTPQLSQSNIRVNAICPGFIKTKFSDQLQPFAEMICEQISMKRFGTPDECAGVVSFLVSDDASYVTGECLVAAGGMTSHL